MTFYKRYGFSYREVYDESCSWFGLRRVFNRGSR